MDTSTKVYLNGNATSECPTCTGTGRVVNYLQTGSPVNVDAVVKDVYQQLPTALPPVKSHERFIHCTPPDRTQYRNFSVYTCGSIEMGSAVQWQELMVSMLSPLPVTVYNPRPGYTNSYSSQNSENEEFVQQFEWELSAMEQADVICVFFDIKTKSSETLLELGLWAASEKIVVCCDGRFWRSGNVDIVCERYGIPLVESFEDMVSEVEKMLQSKGMKLR